MATSFYSTYPKTPANCVTNTILYVRTHTFINRCVYWCKYLTFSAFQSAPLASNKLMHQPLTTFLNSGGSSSSNGVSRSVRADSLPWTVASQAPLSMEFSRQESWSGLPLTVVVYFLQVILLRNYQKSKVKHEWLTGRYSNICSPISLPEKIMYPMDADTWGEILEAELER